MTLWVRKEPLCWIIVPKNTPKILLKPEALPSQTLHNSLNGRDQGVCWISQKSFQRPGYWRTLLFRKACILSCLCFALSNCTLASSTLSLMWNRTILPLSFFICSSLNCLPPPILNDIIWRIISLKPFDIKRHVAHRVYVAILVKNIFWKKIICINVQYCSCQQTPAIF